MKNRSTAGGKRYESHRNRAPHRDLGRVVIPKGDPQDHADPGGGPAGDLHKQRGRGHLQKIFAAGELGEFAAAYAEVLGKVLTAPVLICDRDHVIAAAGLPRKEVLERRAAPALEEIMESRQTYLLENPHSCTGLCGGGLRPPGSSDLPHSGSWRCLRRSGPHGREERRLPSEADQKLVMAAALFLGRQVEIKRSRMPALLFRWEVVPCFSGKLIQKRLQ